MYLKKILLQQVWTQEICLRAPLVIVNNSPSIYLEMCTLFHYTTWQQKLGYFNTNRPSFVLPPQKPMILHTNLLFIHLIFIRFVLFFLSGKTKERTFNLSNLSSTSCSHDMNCLALNRSLTDVLLSSVCKNQKFIPTWFNLKHTLKYKASSVGHKQSHKHCFRWKNRFKVQRYIKV